MTTNWRNGYWRSADGLRLHYRDYAGDPAKAAVICIPGLTRNARDFAEMAERLAGDRRVIVVELRGRGESEWSPDFETYNAGQYVKDMRLLFAELALPRFVLFGTSLGGIMAMILAKEASVAGVLINDIGPVVEEKGMDYLRAFLGTSPRWPDWDAAIAWVIATYAYAYPDFVAADWRAMAERLFREEDGEVIGDYDPAIAILFCMPTPPTPDPWRLAQGLKTIPTLVVHGELSDILTAETVAGMRERLPLLDVVRLPRVGHPALLTEQDVEMAIDRLLARVDSGV